MCLYFVCNPASQSGHGIEVWNTIQPYLAENEIQYEISFSKKHGHVEELVRNITTEHLNDAEIMTLIILGGDGTLDEALQGIADFSKVNLGYIPTGSGNDFARALAYSDNPIVSLKHILSVKEPRMHDLGLLEYLSTTSDRTAIHPGPVNNIHYFDVSCGIGFDAGICVYALVSRFKDFLNKIGLGKLIYVFISLKLIFTDVKPHISLLLDKDGDGNITTIEADKLRFVVGMNTCYEGGGFKFAPDAVPDDGYLDLCMVNNMSALGAITTIPKASKGEHVKNKHVHTYHAKSYEVISDEPLWVHTDGEVFTKSSHIRVSCVPAKLRLLI